MPSGNTLSTQTHLVQTGLFAVEQLHREQFGVKDNVEEQAAPFYFHRSESLDLFCTNK